MTQECKLCESINVEDAHELIVNLQASAGVGSEAHATLRERYAQSSLTSERGWHIVPGVFEEFSMNRVVEYRYYGELCADGTPTGEMLGSKSPEELYRDDEEPKFMGTSLRAVHLFLRATCAIELPRGGGGGCNRMSAEEERQLRSMMTPRRVFRDGKEAEAEAVTESLSESKLPGCWIWKYKTRHGGKSAGFQDVLFYPPVKVRPTSTQAILLVRSRRFRRGLRRIARS